MMCDFLYLAHPAIARKRPPGNPAPPRPHQTTEAPTTRSHRGGFPSRQLVHFPAAVLLDATQAEAGKCGEVGVGR